MDSRNIDTKIEMNPTKDIRFDSNTIQIDDGFYEKTLSNRYCLKKVY